MISMDLCLLFHMIDTFWIERSTGSLPWKTQPSQNTSVDTAITRRRLRSTRMDKKQAKAWKEPRKAEGGSLLEARLPPSQCARKRCQMAKGSRACFWQRECQWPLSQAARALAVSTAPSTVH